MSFSICWTRTGWLRGMSSTSQAIGPFGADAFELHRLERADPGRVGQGLGDALGLPGRISLLRGREAAQGGALCPAVGVADLDQVDGLLEVGGGVAAKIGRQQEVFRGEQRETGLNVLLGEDVHHLGRDPQHRAQRVAPGQGRADVHRNDDVGAHALRNIHRQVVHQATIAQDLAVHFQRRENSRHRHAGAQRGGEVAVFHHHGLAGLHVGGDRAEGRGQAVEGGQMARGERVAAQQHFQRTRKHGTGRQPELAIAKTHLQHGREFKVLFLAALREQLPGLPPIEQIAQSKATSSRSSSSAFMPLAYRPPMMAPMEVPTMKSTGTRASFSVLSTPTWANPRAPPPDNTSPMRGRGAWDVGA